MEAGQFSGTEWRLRGDLEIPGSTPVRSNLSTAFAVRPLRLLFCSDLFHAWHGPEMTSGARLIKSVCR